MKIFIQRILGFISINNAWEAVIKCALKPLCWDDIEKNFIQEIQLGTDFDILFVTVPINLNVHPLCAIPDCGGQDNKHSLCCFTKKKLEWVLWKSY